MERQTHPLISPALGTQRTLSSLHFGVPGSGPKAYIQASLHADELPGMLVAHCLREKLQAAEQAGRLLGQVVLVPIANPIGLDQSLLQHQLGRFEMASGENFNRHYPVLARWLREDGHDVAGQLTADAAHNVRVIRQAMLAALDRHPPETELQSLRQQLTRLACDADIVLDLHCDFEAALHLYTEPECEAGLWPLACRLGARAVLVARGSGTNCFDEAMSGVWWQLREALATEHPIAQACLSATVELRGQSDVREDLAEQDAQAIMDFLCERGVLAGPVAPSPPPACTATPLAGSLYLHAPHAGVISYLRQPGEAVQPGEVIARIIDPVEGRSTEVRSDCAGVLYARQQLRWATTGMELAKITGTQARRSGILLGP